MSIKSKIDSLEKKLGVGKHKKHVFIQMSGYIPEGTIITAGRAACFHNNKELENEEVTFKEVGYGNKIVTPEYIQSLSDNGHICSQLVGDFRGI